MTKRTKTKARQLPIIRTRAEAEKLVNQYAQLRAEQAWYQATMDKYILDVKQRYASDIEYREDQAKTAIEVLLNWAQSNPEEFDGKKSIQFPAGTIGFRTGTPKLELASRKWTWSAVLQRLIELGNSCFIRTKEEVDKEAILARYSADGLLDGDLTTMGVRVVQEESFFVDPDLTKVEQRQTQTT